MMERPRSRKMRLTRMAHDNSGVVAIIVAILLPVFIGFAALAIDMSYARWTRTELQHTASAAALAGVLDLTDTPADGVPDTADYRKKAVEYAYKNMSQVRHGRILQANCGTYVTVTGTVTGGNECDDVKAGNWNPATRRFTAWDDPFDPVNNPDGFNLAAMDLDAVKVYTHRAQANGNPLNLFLAAAVGLAQTDVNTYAIAWGPGGGGGGTSCYEDGILAGGEVTIGSDAVFNNNFCIYGREGVTFISAPVIEAGTQIGALGSEFCTPDCSDCGAQCGTINFLAHECYVPRDTYLVMPPEECDAVCAAEHDGYADRLEWLQNHYDQDGNPLCQPMQPAMAPYGLDLQPVQAQTVAEIIDGIKIGDPPQITSIEVIGTLGIPGPIPFQTEHPQTGVVTSYMGYTLPPPAEIVDGRAYIINGDFYVDNVIYDLTNNIVAVRGTAHFDGGAFRNVAPCGGTDIYKLGFYATGDLYMRDVATGVDLIAGGDVMIGENFNEFEPGPQDVSIQAGGDIVTDEDGHNLKCPDRIKSYGEEPSYQTVRIVD